MQALGVTRRREVGCDSYPCQQLSKGTGLLLTHLSRAGGCVKTQENRTVNWQVVFQDCLRT